MYILCVFLSVLSFIFLLLWALREISVIDLHVLINRLIVRYRQELRICIARGNDEHSIARFSAETEQPSDVACWFQRSDVNQSTSSPQVVTGRDEANDASPSATG